MRSGSERGPKAVMSLLAFDDASFVSGSHCTVDGGFTAQNRQKEETDGSIRDVLENASTVATVGASRDPSKAAGGVPLHLQEIGFRVIPVNPSATELYGVKPYPSLLEIDEPVDVVQVFRPGGEAAEIARQAVQIGAKVLWLQLGITSPEARRIAEDAGMTYVEDRCMAVESRRLGMSKRSAA